MHMGGGVLWPCPSKLLSSLNYALQSVPHSSRDKNNSNGFESSVTMAEFLMPWRYIARKRHIISSLLVLFHWYSIACLVLVCLSMQKGGMEMTFIRNVLTGLIKFEFQRTGAFSGLCTKLIVWHGFCSFLPKKAFPMLCFLSKMKFLEKIVTINLDRKLQCGVFFFQ